MRICLSEIRLPLISSFIADIEDFIHQKLFGKRLFQPPPHYLLGSRASTWGIAMCTLDSTVSAVNLLSPNTEWAVAGWSADTVDRFESKHEMSNSHIGFVNGRKRLAGINGLIT